MNSRIVWFNLYVLLLAILWVAGCKTAEERKRDNTLTRFWLHLSVPAGRPDTNNLTTVTVAGVDLWVNKNPFLTEQYIESAAVVDTRDGGYAIQVQYNEHGKLMLDAMTSEYRGRHIAIYAEFGVKKSTTSRWLAAPMITSRIADGVLIFTPSATRPEAEEVVLGLKNAARNAAKPWVF